MRNVIENWSTWCCCQTLYASHDLDGVLGYWVVVLGKASNFGRLKRYKACSYGLIVEINW